MTIRLWNKTKDSFVRNEDGDVCEFEDYADALKSLERVNEVKRFNAANENDEIVIYLYSEFTRRVEPRMEEANQQGTKRPCAAPTRRRHTGARRG